MGEEKSLLAQLEAELPLGLESVVLPSPNKKVGLVIVDEVNGFCTVGAGNLAPQVPLPKITQMVEETVTLAKSFSARGWPIIAFLDTHEPDKPEPPYPPHCIIGTGEENLVPKLLWLEKDPNTLLMRKDCIDAFVGGIQKDGSNTVSKWVSQNNVQQWRVAAASTSLHKLIPTEISGQILVVGICTDICVMDFVLTALSARNHGTLTPLQDVYVYTEGCSTYHLPTQLAKSTGALPHPQNLTHYMGLYFAKARGAMLVNSVELRD